MKSIKRYATEAAYNADVQSNNIVANQVSKTMDTGAVHYVINDYSHTFTFDGQNPTRCHLLGNGVTLIFNSTQIGDLNDLQFNILKNGGREFYMKDVQDVTTYHIQEVKYSINALIRFGWETYGEEDLIDLTDVISTSCEGGGLVVANCFLHMKDVVELKIETKGDAFILRDGNDNLLLVFKNLDDFASDVEYLYNNPVGVDV